MFQELGCLGESFGNSALVGAVVGLTVFAAPGHDRGVVLVAGGAEVAGAGLVVVASHALQLFYELTNSRVFSLKKAAGVKSIRCDHGVRPLLLQRSR